MMWFVSPRSRWIRHQGRARPAGGSPCLLKISMILQNLQPTWPWKMMRGFRENMMFFFSRVLFRSNHTRRTPFILPVFVGSESLVTLSVLIYCLGWLNKKRAPNSNEENCATQSNNLLDFIFPIFSKKSQCSSVANLWPWTRGANAHGYREVLHPCRRCHGKCVLAP